MHALWIPLGFDLPCATWNWKPMEVYGNIHFLGISSAFPFALEGQRIQRVSSSESADTHKVRSEMMRRNMA